MNTRSSLTTAPDSAADKPVCCRQPLPSGSQREGMASRRSQACVSQHGSASTCLHRSTQSMQSIRSTRTPRSRSGTVSPHCTTGTPPTVHCTVYLHAWGPEARCVSPQRCHQEHKSHCTDQTRRRSAHSPPNMDQGCSWSPQTFLRTLRRQTPPP